MFQTEKLKKVPLTVEHATLMAYEILYLWNALPTCSQTDLQTMLTGRPSYKILYVSGMIQANHSIQLYTSELALSISSMIQANDEQRGKTLHT